MTRWLVALLLGVAFVTALILATRREARVECAVCLDFAGRSACRTAVAADQESALRGAVSTACAVLSGGVTQGLECDRTPPRSVQCSE